MITETSALGAEEGRSLWLAESIAAVKSLRAKGVPVLGYTWFPLFTMIDWRYRLGRKPIEAYHINLGLYKLDNTKAENRWQSTMLVDQMRHYIHNPEESIGRLNPEYNP